MTCFCTGYWRSGTGIGLFGIASAAIVDSGPDEKTVRVQRTTTMVRVRWTVIAVKNRPSILYTGRGTAVQNHLVATESFKPIESDYLGVI